MIKQHLHATLVISLILAGCSNGSNSVDSAPSETLPVAVITAPLTADEGDVIALIASLDSDPAGSNTATYQWTQTSGPNVLIDGASSSTASVPIPLLTSNGTITFQVTVTDSAGLSDTETHSVQISPAPLGTLVEIQTEHDDERRIYTVYTPSSVTADAPIIYTLHGASGNMRGYIEEGQTPRRWLTLADENGFVVVIPNGFSVFGDDGLGNLQGWNSFSAFTDADDVGFLLATIDEIAATRTVDTDQVFFTGRSNGGDMAMRMAVERPSKVKAIASYVSNLSNNPVPTPLSLPLPPTFLFMGTEDPISNFDGTPITQSARETVDYFADNTFSVLSPTPAFMMLTDSDPNDGCQIFEQTYEDPAGEPTVVYYEGVGSGHNIPDSDPNVAEPEVVRGTLCRDADGIDLAWDFFQSLK
ncbi:MAG: PHB depolymerase family esterase [Pseudomonadota bacterium]